MQKTIEITNIALEVIKGLKSDPKHISSKFFYDSQGSLIFKQIMRMPEYYLTDSEAEILTNRKRKIRSLFCEDCSMVDLVELGAGDGTKTKILIEELLAEKLTFRYIPVDISEDAVVQLAGAMKQQFPGLVLKPRIGDYFQMLGNLSRDYPNRKVVMFLGSNLGNFDLQQSITFLKEINQAMTDNDLFFIGLDLKKDPDVIRCAYDDSQGFTRDFNLNLLARCNRELGANFDLASFKHAPIYDPLSGIARSYLISTRDQVVRFAITDESISFKQWETIQTEISQKYDLDMVEALAEASGFMIVENLLDKRQYYLNSLWRKIQG